MQSNRVFTLSCLSLALLTALSGQAFAAPQATVGLCAGPGTHYTTIQAAITAAGANATISVCPGTYPEQVEVSHNLTLQGIVAPGKQDAAVIVPPTTGMTANATDIDDPGAPMAAQIWVHGAASVSILNLTVDGLGNGIAGCSPDFQGILFQNASGTVNHVALRNQYLSPAGLGGCQSGESIFVQTGESLTSTVTVKNSSVHNYQKNGITGNDLNTTLNATANYVQGSGVVPVPGAAQNGIQLAFGATGHITGNTVIDNIYGDPNVAASTDILLYDTADSSSVTVGNNTVGNSQLPIALYTDGTAGQTGNDVSVTNNRVFGTAVYDGIDVCTNNNTITGNTIFNSAESGVDLDPLCGGTGNGNSVTSNTFVESACAGILNNTGTNSNITAPNSYFTVPFKIASDTSGCYGGSTPHHKGKYKYSPAR